MNHATFKSNRSEFNRKNDAMIDMAMGHMTQDIEYALKLRAGMPVKDGRMKASTTHFRVDQRKFRVEIGAEYAATQEAGITASGARIRNYTTAGTSAGFFQRAIDMVLRNKDNYVLEAATAVGL